VQQGAAVVSNSWSTRGVGPALRGAFSAALSAGRGGKGCVVVCSTGNKNVTIRGNNALAQRPGFVVVAAHNDRDVRSGYSNFGAEVSVCAPSDGTSAARDFWQADLGSAFQEDGSRLQIFTTDRTGPADGFNAPDSGSPDPESGLSTNYTSQFGGTSAACPQVSGVAALMLSINPGLTPPQVLFLLEATADKIDAANTDPVGRYQPTGRSQWYGFGRVNAFEAVRNARASVPQGDSVERVFVKLKRTAGNRFVSTQVLHAVDARRRPASTAGDVFIRTGPDGFLRTRLDSVIGPLDLEAEVDE
jgi:subtilisin family serine protease